ncbi:MAG: D-2-hydroxyacid dehydrogenase [Lachnospiraceae bacterium]|nr:D-2-hydroxyacid dehydrogenase [Lachnospiraceae bacterium]
MKIVLLDGYTLNPGDLSWEPLEKLGEFVVYDRTAPEETLERMKDAEIVISNKTVITRAHIEACEKLQYLGVTATGYNVIDIEAAKEKGIPVCNVPGYSTDAVAQMTFSLLLELTTNVALHSASVYDGQWCRSRDFCYWKAPVVDLAGKTMGLIGFGSIGQKVAQIAVAFGMNVLVYSRTRKPWLETDRIHFTDLDTLLSSADVVSLHCPLFPETKELINKNTIAKMKDGAYLLNTARGACINEADVAEALKNGKLAGAGADVVSVEPMRADNPLLKAPNMVITPHISWASNDSRKRLMQIVADNIEAFQKGSPVNNVWA